MRGGFKNKNTVVLKSERFDSVHCRVQRDCAALVDVGVFLSSSRFPISTFYLPAILYI